MKTNAQRRRIEIAGFVDIGTTKVVCIIAEMNAGHYEVDASTGQTGARVIGVGHHRAAGIKAGVLIDIDAAERSVRAAVSQAERMADVELDAIYVAVACGRLTSKVFNAGTDTETGIVTANDMARIDGAARAFAERDGRSLVHLNRLAARVDDNDAGADPIGLAAKKVAANIHTVAVDETPLRNLNMLIERCYLEIAGLVVTPYASALAATTEHERQLGVSVIDLGGGTATLAQFADGGLRHVEAIPVGGQHITFDIARTLQTPLDEAERIKALYGTVVPALSDEHAMISYSLVGGEEDDGVCQTSKAQLAGVIRPRVASILGLVAERLAAQAEKSGLAPDRIVLTGGSSQLVGLNECAADVFRRPVRVARPIAVAGLPTGIATPAFATVVGMIAAKAFGAGDLMTYGDRNALQQGYVSRVGQWLKDGF